MHDDGPPDTIYPRSLDAKALCPAAEGSGSKRQSAPLERWIATNTALEAVLVNDIDLADAISQNTKHLDAIQGDLVANQVRVAVELLDDPDTTYDFDSQDRGAQVDHPTANVVLSGTKGIEATHADGSVEFLKLRTGRRGTGESEAAVLLTSDDTHTISDLMVTTGAIEPITMTDTERTEQLERLFSLSVQPPNRGDRRPGWHCYFCDRIATCGQYPPEQGVRIGRWQRTILLTKTELLNLGQCHRRIAWKRLHSIPKDETPDDTAGAERGTRFHDLLAITLLADDQDAEFQRQLADVDMAHQADMVALYARHSTIESDHVPVEYTYTEYQVGVTLTARGIEVDSKGTLTPDKPIAVTVIARTDAVGREQDGTPAVIEHRTGTNSDRIDERETALYALSVARLVKSDTVAVHQHALDASGGPRCERILYTEETLAQAAELLTDAVAPVVNWHPLDALQPTATPGDWCAHCDYRYTCPEARL